MRVYLFMPVKDNILVLLFLFHFPKLFKFFWLCRIYIKSFDSLSFKYTGKIVVTLYHRAITQKLKLTICNCSNMSYEKYFFELRTIFAYSY